MAKRISVHQKLDSQFSRPRTVEDITQQNIDTVVRLEEATQLRCSFAEKVADQISALCGSISFVWLHIVWFGGWVTSNTWLPQNKRFDPFPFPLLTLVVSLEAIFLSAFILISQNRQSKLDARRAHLDLQIDLLAEQENTKMLQLLREIAVKVGVDLSHDKDVHALAKATKAENLVEQIESSIARTEDSNENHSARVGKCATDKKAS